MLKDVLVTAIIAERSAARRDGNGVRGVGCVACVCDVPDRGRAVLATTDGAIAVFI